MHETLAALTLEIGLTILFCLALVVDLLLPRGRKSAVGILTVAGLAALLLASLFLEPRPAAAGAAFALDAFALFTKRVFLVTAILVAGMSFPMLDEIEDRIGEYFALLLSATLGLLLVSGVRDLLCLFLSLELTTFSFFLLTTFLRDQDASVEAGVKYLVMGAVASAFLLYGVAYLYGTSGETSYDAVASMIRAGSTPGAVLWIGLGCFLVGLGFKVAAVPFQMWVPDVYQGAPTPVTAFLTIGSKGAGLVLLLRFLAEVAAPLHEVWSPLLATLGVLTLLWGNLGALVQTDVKRLMGYSSIGHAGFLFLGLACASPLGNAALLYYFLAYAFTGAGAFSVLVLCGKASGSWTIASLAGLSRRAPYLAMGLTLCLLSLAGVPPLGGFFGKLLIFAALVQQGVGGGGSWWMWLAAMGAVNVVISLYYYLYVVKTMYIDEATAPSPVPSTRLLRLAIGFCLVAVLVLGVVQGPFVSIAETAAAALAP